ncbi:CoA-transferase [Paraburkholderia hospita]|uniref:CoA-transferase n=2 Tax=Paraburkholderia hospita TaxID=169430 RepID=UPI003F505475
MSSLPGACTFDSAMSFGLIRGGHVDLTVLGALQVDEKGHLANWLIPGTMVPGMGGAMDLATGARRVVIAMQHMAKGKPEIVRECSLPLTTLRPVDLVVTELAVISFDAGLATLLETAPGVSVQTVLDATEAHLFVADHVSAMRLTPDGRASRDARGSEARKALMNVPSCLEPWVHRSESSLLVVHRTCNGPARNRRLLHGPASTTTGVGKRGLPSGHPRGNPRGGM